jgi:hypothetical protein
MVLLAPPLLLAPVVELVVAAVVVEVVVEVVALVTLPVIGSDVAALRPNVVADEAGAGAAPPEFVATELLSELLPHPESKNKAITTKVCFNMIERLLSDQAILPGNIYRRRAQINMSVYISTEILRSKS